MGWKLRFEGKPAYAWLNKERGLEITYQSYDIHISVDRLLSVGQCSCPRSLSCGGPGGALAFASRDHPNKCGFCSRSSYAAGDADKADSASPAPSATVSPAVPPTSATAVPSLSRQPISCADSSPSRPPAVEVDVHDGTLLTGSGARIFVAIPLNGSTILRLGTIQLEFDHESSRDNFVRCIRREIEALRDRPRRLLVFINPFGGRKRARSIYNRKVAPVFHMCGIQCTVVITTHAGHSKEYVAEKDLSAYDGVVCVGGDGMANELINGIMQRTLHKSETFHHHHLQQQRKNSLIVHGTKYSNNNKNKRDQSPSSARDDGDIIGDGEGYDGVASRHINGGASLKESPESPVLSVGVIPAGSTDALVYTTTGTHCALNSALNIAIGSRIRIDLGSIHSQGRLVRFFAGFLSYGFFGDNVQSAEKYRWMGPLRYSWTGWQTFLKNRSYGGRVDVQQPKNDLDGDKPPVCLRGCERCRLAPFYRAYETQQQQQQQQQRCSSFEGQLQSLSCSLLANRCSKSRAGFAPRAHLGDGLMDVCVVKECSRVDFLRFLAAIGSSHRQDPFDFPFVHSYRALSFKFSPDNNGNSTSSSSVNKKSSVWHCDGEVLQDCTEITVICHNQVLTVFASGVSDDDPANIGIYPKLGPLSASILSPRDSCLAEECPDQANTEPSVRHHSTAVNGSQTPTSKDRLQQLQTALASEVPPLCAAAVLCGL